ncbi:hypothetical protein [Lysobacter firmicutimachus]|uniref:Cytochrome c assembly protein domain-containing protein n=1 Tax=Lysobacter firmicutimachus TaxID=1792846 RepID=A0ABU8D3L5_9GAMM
MLGSAIAALAGGVLLVGPVLLALAGVLRLRGAASASAARDAVAPPWNRRLSLNSALLYTLAFNLTFFVQELFLVLPKALTPGLRPTLFHNNHAWQGEHPLAALFQGSGAVATVVVASLCAWRLRRPRGGTGSRLFLIWMAYCGWLMALPQVAIGAISDGSDLGMAMRYLQWGPAARLCAAALALAAIPFAALSLLRPLLALADAPERIAGPAARTRFVFQCATLPALLGTALTVPFRMPREWIEVALLPAWVALFGLVWIQAGAWRVQGVRAGGAAMRPGSTLGLALAAAGLLLVFQLLLRPGIAFY